MRLRMTAARSNSRSFAAAFISTSSRRISLFDWPLLCRIVNGRFGHQRQLFRLLSSLRIVQLPHFFLNTHRNNTVRLIESGLDRPAAGGFVDGPLHRIGDHVAIHEHPAAHVSSGTSLPFGSRNDATAGSLLYRHPEWPPG